MNIVIIKRYKRAFTMKALFVLNLIIYEYIIKNGGRFYGKKNRNF